MTSRLEVGAIIAPFAPVALDGTAVQIPSPRALVHLQFRRFAGCPICNLHLRSFAQRIDELKAAKIEEVAVFHSNAETMRPFQGDLPFLVIADPEKSLYARFGVTASLRSILDPRAWPAYFRGAAARHPSSTFRGEGGHLGLPADFLIDSNGRIVACKYGAHADDQWSCGEVLVLAAKR